MRGFRAGAALRAARRRKERRYLELAGATRCCLVVFAMEVGGRWSTESTRLVHDFARARARSAPVLLRASAKQAWFARWTGMLAVAALSAFAATLLEEPMVGHQAVDGDAPELGPLLQAGRVPPHCSRLLPR